MIHGGLNTEKIDFELNTLVESTPRVQSKLIHFLGKRKYYHSKGKKLRRLIIFYLTS